MQNNQSVNKQYFYLTFLIPLAVVILFIILKSFEYFTGNSLVFLGVYPREIRGLIGIFTSHFIHSDFKHLANNSVPFYVLSVALFYFYKKLSFRVFFLTFLITNIWLWGFGRPSYHIGASGWLYALFFFIAVSGFIRRNKSLLIISLLSVFLYGGMVWGIFPIDYKVSFEAHLLGAICGIVLALYYRKEGPQKDEYRWEEEEEVSSLPTFVEDFDVEVFGEEWISKSPEKKDDFSKPNQYPNWSINYQYVEKKNKDESEN